MNSRKLTQRDSKSAPSRNYRLQIRATTLATRHTHPCVVHQFTNTRLTFAPYVAQSFDGDIHADLVAILKTVRHRFRRFVDSHLHAFEHVFFDSFFECRPGKADDAEGRTIGDLRAMSFAINHQPHFMGYLRRQFMKLDRGDQAHHAARDAQSGDGEVVMLRDLNLRLAVDAACDALKLTASVTARQVLARDTGA